MSKILPIRVLFLFSLAVLFFLIFSCQTVPESKEKERIADDTIPTSQEGYLQMLYAGADKLFIESLFDGLVDVSWKDGDGATFLHHAVWLEKKEITRLLIEHGARLNAQRADGFTPLHWAAYRGNTEIAELLIDNGAEIDPIGSGSTPLFWAAARENTETALFLLDRGADCLSAGKDYPSPLECFERKLQVDLDAEFKIYNSSIISALLEDSKALQQGQPDLPPFPEASLRMETPDSYLDRPEIQIRVSNLGTGDMFRLTADVTITGIREIRKQIYFGKIEPDQTISRTFFLSKMDYADIGKELSISVSFTEYNDYIPENLSGEITIPEPDSLFITDHLKEVNLELVRTMINSGYFTRNDLGRAFILRASELTVDDIKPYVASGLIDRTVVNKLIKHDKIPYTISDLVFFARYKSMTQKYLEQVLLEKRIPFTPEDIIEIAELNYISPAVTETLLFKGTAFSGEQIRKLASLKAFSLPEVLYTYTINDGDSEGSSGNKDGIIHAGEVVQLNLMVKNNSSFNMSDVLIRLGSTEQSIELAGGGTADLNTAIRIDGTFADDILPLKILIQDRSFGTLVDGTVDLPVHGTGAPSVISVEKKITTVKKLVVMSGASKDSSRIAALSEGAVLEAVGESGAWYKVKMYGAYGWVEKSQVEDFDNTNSHSFFVENRKDFAVEVHESDTYAIRAFINSRPSLRIISPTNNDTVFNQTDLEITARDRIHGIASIDIRVNDVPIKGSSPQGFQVSGTNIDNYHGTYPLTLSRGENVITVTAYNTKGVASDTQVLHLHAQGTKVLPSLYVLSVGISNYMIASQDLPYAADDALKIAEIFRTQTKATIYGQVHIKTLLNEEATRNNIKNALYTFLSNTTENDMVVLFFTGHGLNDNRGQYYLLGYDGILKNPTANGIRQRELENDIIASIQAQNILLMLDSCQKTEAVEKTVTPIMTEIVDHLSTSTESTVMCAVGEYESAYVHPGRHNGAFTLAIEEALIAGKADINQNGYVDIPEMAEYVRESVIRITGNRQHPLSKFFSDEAYSFYQVR